MTTGGSVPSAGVSLPAADARVPVDPQQAPHGVPGGKFLPYGLGLIAALLMVGGFSLGVYIPNLHNGLLAAAFTAVGVFVLRRRPGHREGWLFVAAGVAHA